jgi:hypothetical protein
MISASAGGLASTANGKLKVQIPSGALTQDTAITIRQIAQPASGAIGPAYEIGPTGTLFQRTVTLAFSFAGLSLDGADPKTLHVATFSGGTWVPVVSAVDRANSIVTGQITHLSIWSLMVYTDVVPPEPDASTGGDMDAGADAPSGQGGSAGSGGGGGMTAGTGGGGGGAGAGGAGGKAGTGGGGQAGGAAGSGGMAGSAGAAGSAGTAGSAGAAGSGAAGAGGAAGGSGAGGAGGAAGAGGAGQGGAAGQDVDAATGDAGADADPDAPVS